MLRRSRLLSLSFPTITLALLSAVAGCGEPTPDTTGGIAQGGAGGTGGQGGQGGGGTGGTGGQGGQGGGGTGGTGGMEGCALGTTQACYSGPDGSQGVGPCKAGVQTCEPNGEFGACVDEVLPATETCNGVDDDCNGAVDDNPSCVCQQGEQMDCYDGPPGTAGMGVCVMGKATCAPDGQGYGACENQVLPSAEVCNMLDDDCDGVVDDGIGCACAPNTTETCYTGPNNTAGVGVCKAGTHTCLPDGTGYGACMGEVLPSLDNCASPADEDCSGAALACTGNHVASKPFGDASNQIGLDVAIDAQGNVYTIGNLEGTINFGGAIGALTSAGSTDVIVVKYDPTGAVLWAKKYGDASTQIGNGIAVDGAGNVFVTGAFQGSINFGGGPFTSAGGDDLFVAKLDTNGGHLWTKSVGNTATQQGADVGVDAQGGVYVTGHFSGNLNFVGVITNQGGFDALLLKFASANGNPVFGKGFGGTGTQYGYEVAVTPAGQVSLVGAFQNQANFGGGNLTSAGDYDIVVARYDSAGGHLWSKGFGDASEQRALAVAVDPNNGSVVVTGEMAGSVSFDGGATTLTSADGTGNVDGFVAKLDAMGNHVWSKKFGNPSAQRGKGVAIDVFGNIVVTGEFFNQVDFGGGAVVSAGGRDVFVAKLNPDGGPLWVRRYGSGMMTDQAGEAVAIDPLTNTWVTGFFENIIDFGGGPFTSAGGTDMFLAKLAP
ncbi:SBBP repeat-containing protein [Polyangium sp. y55x31]|uniref:SBBP repeat-containing protein n=1 Tax=Polyangium sp. y55x31 TaxID=3042688 RepID=UPI0024826CBF|nr:SBBP repeat-containing protein [Polyangium sp. y55x31]MDI1479128.1 SBBP repeat-containing protein [Polyangium sp. y55x31]